MSRKSFLQPPIFIVDGARTPIGTPYRSFRNLSPSKLAASVIKKLIVRNKIKKNQISEIVFGNVVSAGLGQNIARQASLLAGLPATIPCYTVNNVCGAGLQSVIVAAQSIQCGNADISVVGGVESVSHAPFLVSREAIESKDKVQAVDSVIYDGLWCQITGKHMGELVESLVKRNHISRKEQDLYSLASHQKACSAQHHEKFINEIVPIHVDKNRTIAKDDHPRRNLRMDSLKMLPSAFKKRGSVTAGNSSIPCDGAAAVILASEKAVKKYKLKPLARLSGYVNIAGEPELTFEETVGAIKTCLKRCSVKISDIDLFEISEAFAAQVILIKKKLKIPDQKVNIFGGDIAFGHPLGAVGTRILVTLVNALHDSKGKRGLASLSYGGGGAVAIIVEAIH